MKPKHSQKAVMNIEKGEEILAGWATPHIHRLRDAAIVSSTVFFASDWKPASLLSGTTMNGERVTTGMQEMWSNLIPSLILKSCLLPSKKT